MNTQTPERQETILFLETLAYQELIKRVMGWQQA